MAKGNAGGSAGRERKQGQDKPVRAERVVPDRRIQPVPGSRQSVAAARQTSASSNRTQLRIGAVATLLIIGVVVFGLVMNKQQNASPVTDHPKSLSSISGVDDGIVTVSGSGPPSTLIIDLYEDGICPACQTFESQYGQQIMKAVDEDKLTVRYHFLNFLNPGSASKDYSTRAAAAFECVGAVPVGQAPKGLFLNFHTVMFSSGVQPAENGDADLSNADLARLAVEAGAPASAATCITSGVNIAQAQTVAKNAAATLTALAPGGVYGTPSATRNGALLNLNSDDWLTRQLA